MLAVAAGVYTFIQSRKPKTEYTTETAKRGDLAQTVSVTGKITPKDQAELGFQISGEISRIYVEVGDEVSAGERIAQLKAGTLMAELAQAEKALEAQEHTYKDFKKKDDTYSKEQRKSQKATVQQYEAAVREAKVNLARTVLYSPIDGKVTERSVDGGETVAANKNIITVVGNSSLVIKADVPESDIVKVQVGQGATVTFDSLTSADVMEAKVTKIDPASTVIQDVVYYKVELELEKVDQRLKPGMSADIDIRTAERSNVISIPLRAVKTEGDREYAEVLKTQDEKSIVEKVYVKTGLKGDEGLMEVTSGLSGGENVITFTKTQ